MKTSATACSQNALSALARRGAVLARVGLVVVLLAGLSWTAQAQLPRSAQSKAALSLAAGAPDGVQDVIFCTCGGAYTTMTLRYERTTASSSNVQIRFVTLGTPGNRPVVNLGVLQPGQVVIVTPPGSNTTLGTSVEVYVGTIVPPNLQGTIVTDCGGAGNSELNKEYTFGGAQTFFRVASITGSVFGTCTIQSDPEITISVDPTQTQPFPVGSDVNFTVTLCNHKKQDASSQTCSGSGSDWPFPIDADNITIDILLRNRLVYNSDATVKIGGSACGTCSVSSSGPQSITVTIPFGTKLALNSGPAGGQPKVEIDFTAKVQDGAVETTTVAIAEVKSIFPSDADATSGDCNLSDFVVSPATHDDCDNASASLLPVELVLFEALVDGRRATLRWETASETNNAGFEIQHRYLNAADKSAAEFETLGWVEGAGTTDRTQTYSYPVSDLAPGRHVFRLKQVDFDGSFAFSPQIEVGVEMPEAFLVSAVYPNPFNPEASFSFGVRQQQQVRIALFDVLGREVKAIYQGIPEAGVTQTLTINASGLPSGTYLLRVEGEQFVDTQTLTLIK